jgi:iron complex outermembrane receptor protein
VSLREVLLIAMLGAGATRGLLAQEPATHDSLAPMTLEPLVASGTRDQRSILVQPVATSVADTAAIRQGRTVGLDEPLRMMPGVQAATRYGLADVRLGIRGSAANTLLGVRGVGVLLDGIPITEPDGAGRLDLIELAAVRSIEVVRGPESARYAGSPAGVVNFRSRTGRDSRGAVIRAQGGSFGTAKLDGYLGDMFADDRGSLFLGGSYTQADGYREHNDGQLARAFLNADYRLAPRTRLSVEASGSNLDTRLPLSLTQAEADTMPEAAAPNAIRFDVGRGDRRYRAGVRLEHELGAAGGTASAYAFYGGRTLQFVAPGLRVDLNFHRVQAGGRVRAVRVGNAAVDIVAGADYDNVFGADRRWLNAPSAPETLLDDGYDAAPNLGLYAQAEWHPSPSVTVTGGARWEHVHFRFESYLPSATVPRKDTTFSQLSPRGIVTWTAAPGRSLYVSVARGFQVPIFAELSGSPGEPFSPVGPKSLWNYEAGTHLLLGSRVLADIAAYYSDVQGEFVPAFGEDGLPETASASKSRNIGLELALTAAATDWLQLSGSYTLSDFRLQEFSNEVQGPDGVRDTVDFSGKRLPGIPVHRATAEARLRPTGTFEASVQLEWQGELFVETGNQAAGTWYSPGAPSGEPFRAAPARALVHIAGRWQLGAVTLFGSAENLLGTRYIASVLPNDFFGRFYETGAGTVLTLGVAFAGWPRGGVNHGTIDEQ